MPRPALAATVLCACLLAGCGTEPEPLGALPEESPPVLGQDSAGAPAPALTFPLAATKNTTRIPGADQAAIAAGAALAVHPSLVPGTRPEAVALVEAADWATAISAAQLAAPPARTPLLFSAGGTLPEVTQAALAALSPTGSPGYDGAQVLRIGTAARPAGVRDTNLEGSTPAARARAIDALAMQAAGRSSDSVLVAPLDAPAFAMPAAGWAAKSGDPVFWAERDVLPAETAQAIRAHGTPRIYLLGPESAISAEVEAELEALGDVTRIGGEDPAAASVAFASFRDGDFGWGVTDPGHGLVFAAPARPADAAAVAPLSGSGSYGPLLVLAGNGLPDPIRDYLLDIRPGYEGDPVRGVYNHGWLAGDAASVSGETQARIDELLEIQPVDPTS